MSFAVYLWIPAHIWSLAYKYKEDYRRAGVPMFSSGGHSGQVAVYGLPSLKLYRIIAVFTPEPWQGWGYHDRKTMYSERVEIVGNQVFDVRAIGGAAVVVFESNNVTVRNNIFARNYIAVDFYRSPFTPGSFVEVVDNVIAYNNIGVRLDPISSPTIYGNYFVENVRDVLPLFNNKARLYNATAKRGNFWGTSTSRYVAVQRVFDQILSEHPQMEILALSPAYGLMPASALRMLQWAVQRGGPTARGSRRGRGPGLGQRPGASQPRRRSQPWPERRQATPVPPPWP